MRVKRLAAPVETEPPRAGEDPAECVACNTPDDSYIWVDERWRVRAMDRPTGLPMVLILECRSHLDMGDLTNLLAAEMGVMTVRIERAIRSLDGVARVHVNRWGDGSAHLHIWFLARPYGQLQLRGTFLSLWDDILPTIPEQQWRENLALVAAWLADFGGRSIAEPPHIQWQSPATISDPPTVLLSPGLTGEAGTVPIPDAVRPPVRDDADGETRDLTAAGLTVTGGRPSAAAPWAAPTGAGNGTATGDAAAGGNATAGTGTAAAPAGPARGDADADGDGPATTPVPAAATPGHAEPGGGATAVDAEPTTVLGDVRLPPAGVVRPRNASDDH